MWRGGKGALLVVLDARCLERKREHLPPNFTKQARKVALKWVRVGEHGHKPYPRRAGGTLRRQCARACVCVCA